jgi:hypothetical protein
VKRSQGRRGEPDPLLGGSGVGVGPPAIRVGGGKGVSGRLSRQGPRVEAVVQAAGHPPEAQCAEGEGACASRLPPLGPRRRASPAPGEGGGGVRIASAGGAASRGPVHQPRRGPRGMSRLR